MSAAPTDTAETDTAETDTAETEAEPAAARGRVQSVQRAIALLDAIAAAVPAGQTVAELALACGINRATAWRLLATLEEQALVTRDPATSRYQIGYTVARLAAAAGVDGVVRRAHHVLERVCAQTGEAASLALASRSELVYVDEVTPPSVLTVNWLARPVPLHATSTGKAWLAWLPEPEARGVLGPALEGFTDATVTDVERLFYEFAEIRRHGYAVSAGELEPALFGVSAPVLSRGSALPEPRAVFSIWGPAARVPQSRLEALGAVAIDAAAAVATSLRD
ncbi:MAG: IclR family transcriptional regulator [Streptosporangiaceae bacterium]